MSYYNRLAYNLRLRRVAEPRVREILLEVSALSQESDQSPQEQFGPADDYAEQFPRGEKRPVASRVGIALLVVCLAAMAVVIFIDLAKDEAVYLGPVKLLPALLVLNIAIMIGTVIAEHRLPAGFRAAAGSAS